jgi:hypothetical protein
MIIPDSARELIPPPGVRLRIAVDRVSGIGPWSD